MFDKIETSLGIKEPDIPRAPEYKKIVQYLIDSQKASVQYYRIVFLIGLSGLIFSIILLLILVYNNSWSIVFKLKEYPGIVTSLITMAFGHIEIEFKKKELFSQLKVITTKFKNDEDEKSITDNYKNWTWVEFQDVFKSE